MTSSAEDLPKSPDVPAIVEAARTLLKDLNTVHLPDGVIRARHLDELSVDKDGKVEDHGLRAVLKGLAGYIEQLPHSNAKVVRRLRGEDGQDVVSILTDIAINPPELRQNTQALRDALTVDGKPIFDHIRSAMKIASHRSDAFDTGLPEGDAPEAPGKLRDKSWRHDVTRKPDDAAIRKSAEPWQQENMPDPKVVREAARDFNTQGGAVDNEQVRKAAAEYDADNGTADDKAISRSADRGLNENHDAGFEADRPNKKEMRDYESLVDDVIGKFEAVSAASLGRGGKAH